MGKERRATERFVSNMFIEFESLYGDTSGRGVVVDVSLGGLAVDTEADLTHEDTYKCHIEIPFSINAKVVRMVRPGQMKRYGLQFIGQSFIDKLLLRKLLKGTRKTKKVQP
ncbi:MAG: PilZ domain-containing protein [Elusimicrobia bacterium]|nr:PilZ domain-containing protein [Candidatus Obscuribacterium magneticum]